MRGGWAKWILLLTAAVVLAAAFLKTRDVAPAMRGSATPAWFETRPRTIGFDNLYGEAADLRTYVRVDGGPEQAFTARCADATCTFELQLTNDRHEVVVAVEQNGRRSQSTRVTLDTSAPR